MLIRPVHSATPTPSMATSTVPNGAKLVKFFVALLNIYLNPSAFNKEMAFTVTFSPVLASKYDSSIPMLATTAEIIIMAMLRITKIIAGFGSALPNLSTPFKKPFTSLLF